MNCRAQHARFGGVWQGRVGGRRACWSWTRVRELAGIRSMAMRSGSKLNRPRRELSEGLLVDAAWMLAHGYSSDPRKSCDRLGRPHKAPTGWMVLLIGRAGQPDCNSLHVSRISPVPIVPEPVVMRSLGSASVAGLVVAAVVACAGCTPYKSLGLMGGWTICS